MARVHFSETASPAFRDLAWEEFFLSRNRGVNLSRHFPWMDDPSAGALYVSLWEGDDLVGGLVLKESTQCMQGGSPRVASVGLVCIRKEYRGQGLSSVLLEATLERATKEGFCALTLWTGKQRVYEKLGFVLADRSLYGWAGNPRAKADRDPFRQGVSKCGAAPLPSAAVSLPPFARDAVVLKEGASSCTIITDGEGPIVAGYRGGPEAAAHMLIHTLPGRWRLNALSGDPILEVLARAGISLDLRPANLQMWKSLDGERSPVELAELSRFGVLERI